MTILLPYINCKMVRLRGGRFPPNQLGKKVFLQDEILCKASYKIEDRILIPKFDFSDIVYGAEIPRCKCGISLVNPSCKWLKLGVSPLATEKNCIIDLTCPVWSRLVDWLKALKNSEKLAEVARKLKLGFQQYASW